MMKNNYPLSNIDNLLDQLNGAKYFSQIDLKLGYYQIRITDENVEKMVMRTRYCSYEFLVTPFRLCNILSMFTTLMNSNFHEKLDEFMIIYIDDILVYSKIVEEHAEHWNMFWTSSMKTNSLPTWQKMNLPRKIWISWGISCHEKGWDLTLRSWKT
jgi:hypothetical protein